MEINDITGILYGFRYGQGTNPTGYGEYHYQFVDTSRDVIQIRMANDPATEAANARQHAEIENAIWNFAGNILLNKIVRTIYSGTEIPIGHLKLNRSGIQFEQDFNGRIISSVLPWKEAGSYSQFGRLHITSFYNNSIGTSIDLLSAWNAVVLERLLFYLRTNKYLVEVLCGQQPPLA